MDASPTPLSLVSWRLLVAAIVNPHRPAEPPGHATATGVLGIVPFEYSLGNQRLGRVSSRGALDRVPVERLLLLDERQPMAHNDGGPGTTPSAALGPGVKPCPLIDSFVFWRALARRVARRRAQPVCARCALTSS